MYDLQLPILLALVYTAAIVFVIGFPAMFLLSSIYAKKRRRTQDEIAKENAEQLQAGPWFRVNYASEPRLRRPTRKELWQSWEWEATGILLIRDAEVVFFGQSLYSPSRYLLTFDSKDATVAWAGAVKPSPLTFGKRLLLISRLFQHWLEIKCEGKKHYFISETGAIVATSMSRTRGLYDRLCEVLPSGGTIPLDDQ
jgi:hypothetical protein